MSKWSWTSPRVPSRMVYLRQMPAGQRLWLFAAVACTFASIGFLSDLTDLSFGRPRVAVLAAAALSGLVACGWLAAFIFGLQWIPLLIVGQFAAVIWLKRMSPGTDPLHPLTLEALSQRATFDALGSLFVIMAGYALFIGFISRQGVRQVRLDTEIALARDIHSSLVPNVSRRVGRFDVVGRSVPSSEVGGDLVDVLEDRGCLLAVIADVSGHGVPAGTLMAMVRTAIRARANGPGTLAEAGAHLDRLLIDLGRPDKFVTVACLRFSPDGEVESLLAGHLPVVVVRADGSVERLESVRPPLGIPWAQGQAAPATLRSRFAPGDLFALLTDGLTEVVDGRHRSLDIDAIETVLRQHAHDPLESVAEAVFERARRHGKIADDQTLLLVRARSPEV